ncbi:MAG: flavodoxin family protein [Oscillospiraceae bacterium]|jgi:multimeric flavodoxin WrbA|nr:flavodoxin family protein [Oscillospiraceae bacterium]
MKVLAINGSPHPSGSTATALRLVAEELLARRIEVEIVHVGLDAVRGCTACGHCRQPGVHGCVFTDDPVNACLEKARESDGILLGSPVYYGGIAGTMKCFLDRFFYAGAHLRYKVGAALVCLRRSGGVGAMQQLYNYLNLAQTVLPPTQYWPVAHGSGQELMRDAEGVQTLQTLGRNMAWLLQNLAEGGKTVPQPAHIQRVWTNFI